jgi:GxxExxY protein
MDLACRRSRRHTRRDHLGSKIARNAIRETEEIELGFQSIEFIPKGELQLYYKGHLLEKKYYPDLLVSGEIITELKSVKVLNAKHERQPLNYMRITRKAENIKKPPKCLP